MTDNFPELQRSAGVIVNDTYSYINNTNFYSLANPTFYDYYYRVVRRCAWWVDGYVYNFHNQSNGIFSTRLATSLVKGISNTIMGERLLYKQINDQDKRSLEFINKWSDKTDFSLVVRRAVNYAFGLGTSLLKINKSAKEYWVEAVRLDYFYFTSDFRGNLEEVIVLIKHYANAMPKSNTNGNSEERNYYLVERRYYKNEKRKEFVDINGVKSVHEVYKKIPMVEYLCKVYTGNTMSMQTYDPSRSGSVNWDSIPSSIKRAIKNDYSVIEIGKPQQLPFADSLGCELIKCGVGDISLPQTPFGSPIIYDIISELMIYDLAFSYYARDMYMGKGMVLMPKGMTQPNNNNPFSGMDASYFEIYESVDPDKQKPLNVQFELRADGWEQIQDNLLRKIATKIGMSPKTIASYLSIGQTQKTATEIDSEDDATISFIEIQRSCMLPAINRIIEDVLNQMGYSNDVKATFSTPSLVNKDKIIDRALKLYQSGAIDELEYLRMVFPEDSETNLKARADDFKKRMNERKTSNPFNLGG